MKNSFFLSTLGCLLLLCSCGSSKKATSVSAKQASMDTNTIIGKKWKLVELNGQPVADKINGKEPFIILQETDSRYSVSTGCNGIGGVFTLSSKGKIKFSQGVSTMMMCPDMSVEDGMRKVLSRADHYTLTQGGDTLSLNKGRIAPLARFVAVTDNEVAQSLNGTWQVDYISGIKIAFEGLYPDKKPVITFNLPDNKATGNSSCNNFHVTFTIDGSHISFSDPAATKMYCPGAGEATFFNTLKTITGYSVTGTTLNLVMGDIAVMRLQKKEDPTP